MSPLSTPDADRYSHDTAYLLSRIKVILGGRAAEEVVYGSVTTGAASDIDTATHLARSMVGRWGMSPEIGLVSTLPAPGEETPWGTSSKAAPATLELVDREVRRIIDECYASAKQTLLSNREKLDSLTTALLERETLDEIDAYGAAGIDRESTWAQDWTPSYN